MPAAWPQGVLVGAGAASLGVELGKAVARGTDGDGVAFGGTGVAIARSSVTVTDLNPFFIN